jgi:hypothetical protein
VSPKPITYPPPLECGVSVVFAGFEFVVLMKNGLPSSPRMSGTRAAVGEDESQALIIEEISSRML